MRAFHVISRCRHLSYFFDFATLGFKKVRNKKARRRNGPLPLPITVTSQKARDPSPKLTWGGQYSAKGGVLPVTMEILGAPIWKWPFWAPYQRTPPKQTSTEFFCLTANEKKAEVSLNDGIPFLISVPPISKHVFSGFTWIWGFLVEGYFNVGFRVYML